MIKVKMFGNNVFNGRFDPSADPPQRNNNLCVLASVDRYFLDLSSLSFGKE